MIYHGITNFLNRSNNKETKKRQKLSMKWKNVRQIIFFKTSVMPSDSCFVWDIVRGCLTFGGGWF